MKENEKKLIKVQFTYEHADGRIVAETLQGDAAEWLKIVNGYVGFQQMRQGYADSRLAQFTWKEEEL